MKYLLIFFIVIIFLIIYFNLLDIDYLIRLILNNIYINEHFTKVFKPNKVYTYKNKIYLLDSNNILKKNINPLIFDNFKKYQEYLLTLEKEAKKFIEDISEKKLPNFDQYNNEYKNKQKEKNFSNFNDIFECKKKVVICNSNNIPFHDDLYSKKCKKNLCKLQNFTEDKCKEYRELKKNQKLELINCSKNKNKNTNKCSKLKYLQENEPIIGGLCNNPEIYNMNKCLLDNYYRDKSLFIP